MATEGIGTLWPEDSDDDAPQIGSPAAPPTRAKPRRVTGSADKKRKLGELSGAVSEDLTHCPVCMDWHRGDIFQCPEGHLLCGPCKAGLQNDACPSCRSPLGSIRARAVEKMLQAVMMPCRWHENGCTETGTSAARTKHEAACKFKRYTCPAKGCTHTCGADEMVDHIVNTHLEAQRAGGDIQDVDKRFTKGLRSKKPWETPEFENGVFAIVARRKNRSLFIITLQMAPGRILLKARVPFDLDQHKYVRVGLSVKENATGVSVPLPLAQTDEWETRRNSLDANDPSVFSFPASIFAHTERSAEDVAAERLRYSVSFEFES